MGCGLARRHREPQARRSLQHPIPNLILQPLVENAVQHGLSRKLGGGTVRIEAILTDGCLELSIGDDGLGMPAAALERVYERGIGLRNLRDRLERLYRPAHLPQITSAPRSGTRARPPLPDRPPPRALPGAPTAPYSPTTR